MEQIKGLDGISYNQLDYEIKNGGKFVYYEYCISILIMTFKRGSSIHFIKSGQNPLVPGLAFSLLSFVLGWWGFPWGPIYTIGALVTNFSGGKDVTTEALRAIKASANQSETAKEDLEEDRW
ncbi:MAG: hypothetical protein AAF518_16530 [Spirochaetota bacterium]